MDNFGNVSGGNLEFSFLFGAMKFKDIFYEVAGLQVLKVVTLLFVFQT